MPRDYSKPPRADDRPRREGYKPRGPAQKPWERREGGPPRGDRPDRGPRQPYGEKRSFGGPRREFGEKRESRPPRFRDDELFTATGKVADVVGPEPQSRYDMLRKLWDFFRDERLVVPAGRRLRANADEWRHGQDEGREHEKNEDRPAPRAPRLPTGEHPTARRARSLEGVPRRKYKETRER